MAVIVTTLLVLVLATAPAAWAQQGFKATPVLKSSTTVTGQPIEYPRTDRPEVVSVILEIAPGGEVGRHMHPIGGYVYVLDGALSLEVENGLKKEYRAGESFIEPREQWHNARNTGDRPVKVLVVTYGEQGKPLIVRPEAGTSGAAAAPGGQPAPSPQ